MSDGGHLHLAGHEEVINVSGYVHKMDFEGELPEISLVGRHSELEVVEFDVEGGYFSVFEGLEYVVGRVLFFFEFGGNCSQDLSKDVIQKSEG